MVASRIAFVAATAASTRQMWRKFQLRPLCVSRDTSRSFPQVSQPAKAVAFSGSGWLLPFHIGVAHVLYNAGVVGPQTTLAGLSGGALAATFMLMDMGRDEAMQQVCTFARLGLTFGNYGEPLRRLLREQLPNDIVPKANERLRISVVKLDAYGLHDVLISDYTSKDDVIDSLLASSHIPFYMSRNFTMAFRGGRYVDGGFRGLLPRVRGVSVTPFSAKLAVPFASVDISSDLVPDFPYGLQDMLRFAFTPASNDTLHDLCRQGEKAAEAYILSGRHTLQTQSEPATM